MVRSSSNAHTSIRLNEDAVSSFDDDDDDDDDDYDLMGGIFDHVHDHSSYRLADETFSTMEAFQAWKDTLKFYWVSTHRSHE